MQPVILCVDIRDTERLEDLDSSILKQAVVQPLSPKVGVRLSTMGLNALKNSAFSNGDHARTVVAFDRAIKRFDTLFNSDQAPSLVIKHLFRQNLFFLINLSFRAWREMIDASEWYIHDGAQWKRYSVRSDAHYALVRRLIDWDYLKFEQYPFNKKDIYLLGLRNIFRAILQRRTVYVTASPNLKFGFENQLSNAHFQNVKVVSVSQSEKPFNTLKRLLRLTFSALSKENGKIQLSLRKGSSNSQVSTAITQSLSSYFTHLPKKPEYVAISITKDALISNAESTATLIELMNPLIRELKPVGAVNHEINTPFGATTSDACVKLGYKSFIANHNSLVFGSSPIANRVTQMLVEQRITGLGGTHYLAWSPLQRDAIRRTASAVDAQIFPIKILPENLPKKKKSNGFSILHAGNYIGWNVFFPWIGETSFEYLKGIQTLTQIVSNNPAYEMAIRVRPKGECDLETVRASIQINKNVTINSTKDHSFYDQVLNSDLVVAFMSTTIEEAIQLRRPVLLWGPTDRYLHLPCRKTPPKKGDRSAVYAVESIKELPKLLEAIAEFHTNQPLTDEEISPFTWPLNTPTILERLAE